MQNAEDASVLSGLLPEYLFTFVEELDEHPWLFAALASILVGLSGIFPLLVIPIDETASFKDGGKCILSIDNDCTLCKVFTIYLFIEIPCHHVCQ